MEPSPSPSVHPDGPGLRDRLRAIAADLAPRHLPRVLTAALVAGGVAIALAVSLAALVFSSDLAAALPMGIGLALFSAVVIGLVTALGSRFSFMVAGPQDNPAAIVAVAATGIAAAVPEGAAVPTVVSMIAVTTLALGAGFLLLGSLRIGGLVRYIPFPVIGGFLAATGVLLVQGGIGVLVDRPEGVGLLDSHAVLVWLPGLVVGVGGYLVARFWARHPMATPAFLLGSVVALRAGMAVAGVGTGDAADRGWLLGPFPEGISWRADTLRVFADADWGAIGGQWAAIASVVVVSVIALLMYIHALEHISGEDSDVDGELRVAGVAALAAGAGAGFPGYVQLSDTMLLRSIAPRRGAVVLTMVVIAAALLGGLPVLDLLPTAVIGGVIVLIGISFLVEWLWDARRRFGTVDHLLVAVIAATVVVAGFLPAIALGIAIAIALFVVRYSRIEVVRRVYPLSTTESTVDRAADQRAVLAVAGERVRIVEVRGFVFFGTAASLFDERRLDPEPGGAEVRQVIFDLTAVTGFDSSAAMAFGRLDRAASRRGVAVAFAGVPKRFEAVLEAAFADTAAPIERFPSLDAALIAAEERLLDQVLGGHEVPASASFFDHLAAIVGSAAATAAMRPCRQSTAEAGDAVIVAGEPAPGLIFLESGRLRVVVEGVAGEPPVTVRILLPGAIIGEISLYRGGEATATVLADAPSRLVQLPVAALEQLERSDPAAAAALHRFCAVVIADRLLHAETALRRGM